MVRFRDDRVTTDAIIRNGAHAGMETEKMFGYGIFTQDGASLTPFAEYCWSVVTPDEKMVTSETLFLHFSRNSRRWVSLLALNLSNERLGTSEKDS